MVSLPYDIRYQVNYVLLDSHNHVTYVGRGETAAERKEDATLEAEFRNAFPMRKYLRTEYRVVEVKP